jgi:two-component system chemotaxis sensor kinase CheA
VQYRGQILPLVQVGRTAAESRRLSTAESGGSGAIGGNGHVPVVVYAHQNKHVGLVIGQILDIVDESVTVESKATRAGVKSTAVVADRVTEILDIHEMIRAADPSLLDGNGSYVGVGEGR